MTCYQCKFLQWKIGKIGLIESYCSIGVTNNKNDKNRKNGICQKKIQKGDD